MKKSSLLLKSLFLLLPSLLAALEITPVKPENGSVLPLLNKQQKAYLAMPRAERIAFFADAEHRRELVKAGYLPLPVEFSWKSDAAEGTVFRVAVSDNPAMRNPRTVPGKNNRAQIDNLMIARTFYWQIEAVSPDKTVTKSVVRHFRTEDQPPRLIRFPNVPNARDIGGYKTMNGMRVRQGRIYRTAGMNDNAKMIIAKNDAELFASRPEIKPVLEFLGSLENGKKLHEIPYSLSGRWTVFLSGKTSLSTADSRKLDALAAIPDDLFGVRGKPMSPNAGPCLKFPAGTERQTAILMQEFTSSEEGVMILTSSGDWYWNVRVNGRLVYTKIYGNVWDAAAQHYSYLIPVRKGRNLVTVTLQSGKDSFLWYCGKDHFLWTGSKAAPVPAEKLLKKEQAELRRTAIGWIPGKRRITPEGFEIFRKELRFLSDIDLRTDNECLGMTGSPLGAEVKWYHISSHGYGNMQTRHGKAAFAEVFRVFLDEKNYPIVFHCISGQDRTGSLAFILNGLLGVPEEQLYLDWESTGFWNPQTGFSHKERFHFLVQGFMDRVHGRTLHEKIENYVLSLGFSRREIARFRTMMLEKQ